MQSKRVVARRKWLCALVALLSFVGFWSNWVAEYGCRQFGFVVGCAEGCFAAGSQASRSSECIVVYNGSRAKLRWLPGIYQGSGDYIFLVPLWMTAVLGFLFYLYYRRRTSRLRVGRCLKCDYDLTGNISGICPECGNTINLKSDQSQQLDSRQRGEGE